MYNKENAIKIHVDLVMQNKEIACTNKYTFLDLKKIKKALDFWQT